MKPIRITARGYRSFSDLDYTFIAGATAITGANGAGKSTLIGAVEVALFGPRSRSLEPLVREGENEMQLTLEFRHGSELYRVRRGWKGGRSTLDFERNQLNDVDDELGLSPGAWVSLTQGNAADTQQLIERTTGLSRTTFNASGYLAQRASDTFTGAQPRDRKRILSDALALDGWQVAADRFGADRRTVEKQLATVESRVEQLAGRALASDALATEAGDLRMLVDVAEAGVAENTKAAEAHAQRAADLDRADSAWKVAKAAVDTAAARDAAHAEKLQRTLAAKRDLDAAREELAAIGSYVTADALEEEERELSTAHEAYRLAKQERHTLLQSRDEILARGREQMLVAGDLKAKAEQTLALIGHSQQCDTCGQTLGEEAARTAADAYMTRANTLVEECGRLAEQAAAIVVPELGDEPDAQDLSDLRRRIQDARSCAARELEVKTRIQGLKAIVAETDTDEYRETARLLSFELAEADNALAAITQPEPGAAEEARAAAAQAMIARDNHLVRGRQASERLAVVNALLEQAQAALVEHAAAVAERDRLHQELDILARLEQACGRDGAPAWIVESQALPQIETEANRILSRLGGAISRVELRTERETKSGEKRDALDIVCLTDDGERALETFSGGEQSRAEIALALGLVDVLQSRQDADLRFLALDEPSGLDTQGTAALAEILVERSAGAVVLLASHDPGLRDSFDQSVLVERGAGGSRVIL